MDISALSLILLSSSILPAAKAIPQFEDSSNRFDGRDDRHLQLRDFPFDTQDRLSTNNDEKERPALDILGIGALGRFPFDTQARLPTNNDEKESRALDILGLGALGRYPGNHLGGALLGSLGGFPASSSGITGENINQNLDQGLFRGLPGSLNGILAPQGLIGAAPGLVGSNPNLIGRPSGLIGSLPGLVAGTNGPSPLGIPKGLSPFGDIMAMASFLTKDELHDMFSKDKNFNFLPVILQNRNKQKEEQEVQQFIRFLNSRSEKEEESLGSENTEFDKRHQGSLNTNPILAQQIRGNALQLLARQNLLQSGVNPLLVPQNILTSGAPNSILAQQNLLQGRGINPLLALQSQLQSAPKNIFSEPLLSQVQSNQSNNGFGLNPLVHQSLLREARLQQSLPSQQPQLQALKQLLLRSARDSDLYEREISARLPVEHKQEPFRFPFE